MTRKFIDLLITLSVGALLPACRQESPPNPAFPAAKAAVARYPLQGVVRAVDRANGIVSIRHDEIAGYMPAMTMPFRLAGAPILDDLRPGDKVRATLVVEGEESRLVDVEITEWADPAEAAANRPAVPRLEPGAAVPDFALTTQAGAPLNLSDLQGNIVVLTFIYTRCPLPDFCPAMDKRFAELARRVKLLGDDAARVRLLSISFDPEHDTPEILAKHARAVGAQPPLWTFAVASHSELAKIAPALGLAYGPGENEIIHTLTTAVIDPRG